MSLSDVGVPVWEESYETFLASVRSVGTACTLAAVGTYMHQKGLISVQGKRMLALISQQVTFPLFLFTKIIYCNQDWSHESCPSVTGSLKEVWLLLFLPVFVVSVGMLVGRVASHMCRTPTVQRKAVMAAVAFGNSTGLPITLLTVVHSNFSKTSDLGRVDPTLFLSVYLLLYPVLQWGLGGWLLAPSKDDDDDDDDEKEEDHEDEDHVDADRDVEKPLAALEESPPPVMTEPLLQAHYERTSMFSVPSTLKLNVLNNKSDDQIYIRRHQGLYSSDEGMYLSDFNLSAMASQSQADLLALQSDYYCTRREQQGSHVGLSLEPSTAQGFLQPILGGVSGGVGVGGGFAAADALPLLSTTAPSNSNNNHNNDLNTFLPMSRTISAASTESAQDYLLYDSPDPTQATSSNGSSSGGEETAELINPLDNNHFTTSAEKSSPSASFLPSASMAPLSESSPAMAAGSSSSHKNYGSSSSPSAVEAKKSSFRDTTAAAIQQDKPSPEEGGDKFKGESITSTVQTVLERCFQPPVVGAVTGILVAISPARGLFVDTVDRNGDAPLEWLFDGLYSVGLTAVPINMIILGCNLSNSYDKFVASSKNEGTPKKTLAKKAKESTLSMKTLVGIVIGKMIVMPLIGFFLAWFLKTFVLDIPSDISAAFYLVLLIVFLTPTANNVMVMVELSGSNTKEGIANVIAMQYAVSPIILSCTMTVAIGYAVSIH